eukprot:5857905-Pleurochrysis_carterae.AAC.9
MDTGTSTANYYGYEPAVVDQCATADVQSPSIVAYNCTQQEVQESVLHAVLCIPSTFSVTISVPVFWTCNKARTRYIDL